MSTFAWFATISVTVGLVVLVGALGWIWHTRRQQRKSTTTGEQASIQKSVTIASAGAAFLAIGTSTHLILLLI